MRAEGNRTARILKAEGEAKAIESVFQAVHRNDPDPKLLAYQYLQTLPQLAQGPNNTFFVIPTELTAALSGVSKAFTEALPKSPATREDEPIAEVTKEAAADAARAASAAAEAVADAAETPPITNPRNGPRPSTPPTP
jgi:hypothetical protein